MANDLIGEHDQPLFMPYGPRWRENRKVFHQNFMESVVENDYMKLVHTDGAQMLRDFMLDSEHYMDHSQRFGNSIMMCIGKSDVSLFRLDFFC